MDDNGMTVTLTEAENQVLKAVCCLGGIALHHPKFFDEVQLNTKRDDATQFAAVMITIIDNKEDFLKLVQKLKKSEELYYSQR